MFLNATTEILEIVTTDAISTDYNIEYADYTSAGIFTLGSTQGNITTATTTTVVTAPASGTTRRIKSIFVRNRDAASQTITIIKDVSGTEYYLTGDMLLSAGEYFVYDINGGINTYTTNGSQKTAPTTVAGWEFLGSTAVATATPNTNTVTFTPRNTLMVQFVINGYSGNDIARFQFNGDTATNYNTRFLYSASGGTTWTNLQNLSATGIALGPVAIQRGRTGALFINNSLAIPKLIKIDTTEASTNAATAAPRIALAQGQWQNTTAQISSMRMIDINGTNLTSGSGFAIYGKDI
jgi:hypothetical protein